MERSSIQPNPYRENGGRKAAATDPAAAQPGEADDYAGPSFYFAVHAPAEARERSAAGSEVFPAVALTAVFTLLTGCLFPLIIWGLGQLLFPYQANGSLLKRDDGTIVGSEIIGQTFTGSRYFHPRPSAAGGGYDASNSSGTNLGPTSAKLINGQPDDATTPDVDESFLGVKDLAAQYRAENGLAPDTVIPSDAATRSASGLDPEISPANAKLQARRVAAARELPVDQVLQLINARTVHRFLGIFGEPRVNVLRLNLALDEHRRREQ